MKEFNTKIEATSVRIIDHNESILRYIVGTIEDAETSKNNCDEWEAEILFTVKVGAHEMDIQCRKVEDFDLIYGDYDVPDYAHLTERDLYNLDVTLWSEDESEEIDFEYSTSKKSLDMNEFLQEIEDYVTVRSRKRWKKL